MTGISQFDVFIFNNLFLHTSTILKLSVKQRVLTYLVYLPVFCDHKPVTPLVCTSFSIYDSHYNALPY